MPRFPPQSLPPRPPGAPQPEEHAPQYNPAKSAIELGRFVREEQGLQGLRAYAAAMRSYLAPDPFSELCDAFEISPRDLPYQPPYQPSQQLKPPPPPPPRPEPPPPPPQNSMNMDQIGQFMQLFSQMNSGGGGGMPGMGGSPLGGMNPMMLSQLMNMMNQKR